MLGLRSNIETSQGAENYSKGTYVVQVWPSIIIFKPDLKIPENQW